MVIKTLEDEDIDLFQEEGAKVLQKSLHIREAVVDEIIKDGVPTSSRDIRVLNEVLNSMDALVFGKVDRKLKKKETSDNGRVLEMVKTIIKNNQKLKNEIAIEAVSPELGEEHEIIDLVPGETKVEYEEITLDEIKGIK